MKEIIMVIFALLLGTALGTLIRFYLDRDLIKDAWGEWDDLYREERESQKAREKRLYEEIGRLHKEIGTLKNPEPVKVTEKDVLGSKKWFDSLTDLEDSDKSFGQWFEALNDTSDPVPDNGVDFGGF